MPHAYWNVPVLWPWETVALIGGGPSLTQRQVDACRGKCRVIVINDALRLAPWADLHYFCDKKWWQWHNTKDWYAGFKGLRVTLENADLCESGQIKSLQNLGQDGLCAINTGLHTGQNSGFQCINLAVHLGAKRILLLGYDMREGTENGKPKAHWFGDHPVPTPASLYPTVIPKFRNLEAPLKALGVEVVNCTPGSAIDCFEQGDIESLLANQIGAALPA